MADQPHLGQQSKLTPAILAAIGQEIGKGDRTWTAGQLAEWVAEHRGVRRCPEHLSRMLKRAKLSYKRTQRSLRHKQDPAQVAEKRADLQTLEKGEMLAAWTSAI